MQTRYSAEATIVELLLMIGLVMLVISIFLLCRASMLVFRVFCKYPLHQALWTSAILCCSSCLVTLLLYRFVQESVVCALLGIAGLLITCKVVELKEGQMLIREPDPIVDQVLHTSWWAHENQLAA